MLIKRLRVMTEIVLLEPESKVNGIVIKIEITERIKGSDENFIIRIIFVYILDIVDLLLQAYFFLLI
jgi:hypothetical protein